MTLLLMNQASLVLNDRFHVDTKCCRGSHWYSDYIRESQATLGDKRKCSKLLMLAESLAGSE